MENDADTIAENKKNMAKKNISLRPVIIVGMPRSGTSFLTRILNQSLNYVLIDDFYIIQKIDAKNLWGTLTDNQAKELLNDMFNQIYARSTLESGMKTMDFSRGDLLSLKEWMEHSEFSGAQWPDVVDSFLSKLAQLKNAASWGYKTPQDHLHIGKLSAAFPTAVFIFVVRDPRDVLLSYKNITRDLPFYSKNDLPSLEDTDPGQSTEPARSTPTAAPAKPMRARLTSYIKTEIQRLKRGDDPRRYNPYVQATAWRLAAQSYFRWKERLPDRVLLIRYESVLEDKEDVLKHIAKALQCTLGDIVRQDDVTNTSFRPGKKKKQLSDSEVWMAEQALAGVRTKLGYTYSAPGFRIQYLPTLCFFMARSGLFFLMQFASSRDRRKRMLRTVSQLVTGSKK